MAVRVLVGAQWGDEGKGKVVDWLGRDADLIARYAGGPNAGHTVVVAGEKTILHHVPSGILTADTTCLLGNGVVVDAGILMEEIRTLEAGGVSLPRSVPSLPASFCPTWFTGQWSVATVCKVPALRAAHSGS